MNTMKWLLRREFWENKGSMFWAPAIISGIMLAVVGASMVYAADAGGKFSRSFSRMASVPVAEKMALAEQVANGYLLASVPLFGVMSFVIFFYCLGALYDDRRDRSILFWKSLPISDEMTVLSKVVAALCLAPLITMAFATILSLTLLLLTCLLMSVKGINLFGVVFTTPQVYLAPFHMLAMWPVYILWALPTIGWLLMVSAWARSKVFLWAVGVPLFVLALIKWITYLAGADADSFLSAKWVAHNVMLRVLLGLEPGSWFLFSDTAMMEALGSGHHRLDLSTVVAHSWASLGSAHAIVGAVAGVAMMYVAVRLRRWREDA
ncbi:MAG: hypothetical protein ABIT83_11285 [Massilia sp.]